MSRENVEVVRRCFELFSAGDLDGLLELVAPDIEITEPSQIPGASTFRGRSRFLEAIDHWAGEFEDFRVDLVELIDAGDDAVVSEIRQRGRGRQSGVPVDIRLAYVFVVRNGKVVRWNMFAAVEEALAAVGLRESD